MIASVVSWDVCWCLYRYHYGKVDVTMEICAAAEKQQWTVEAGSMAEQIYAF